MKARLQNDRLIITFLYNPQTVMNVKRLSGYRWHSDRRYWSAPLLLDNVRKLKDFGFELSAELQSWFDQMSKPKKLNLDFQIPDLKKQLYPFQKEGVAFIDNKNGRALIADEMGLGKTAQSLAWLQLHKTDALPAIVICPASLKLNWRREIEAWTDLRPVIWSGRKTTSAPLNTTADIHIINYDILATTFLDEQNRKIVTVRPDILAINARTVIIDESHYMKGNTQRTKAVMALCKNVKNIIALSGTPITNRPVEFYNVLKVLRPALFPSFTKFAFRYCGPKNNGFGWNFNGASNTQELHDILTQTVMLRRLKADVLKDLPDKQYSVIPMEINNREEYEFAARDLIAWLEEIDVEKAITARKAEALVKFETLKQLAVEGKMNPAIEWIENFLESGEKLVTFCTHKVVIAMLMEKFKDIAVGFDGSTPSSDRQKAVEQFQTNNNIKLFIGNIQAAGVGITLTAASSVAFLELPWQPGALSQAEDRCHRIGQKECVNVYYLIAEDTVEEDIIDLLDEKRKILDGVLDGKDTKDEDLLSELIKKFRDLQK